jgi:hypothetical protein
MRGIVCGGRNFNHYSYLYYTLDEIQDDRGPFTHVITGDATGADHWAESWAWMGKITHIKFGADWIGYGRKAGSIRNALMISEGKPDLVVAFPGGNGTADMVARAEKAGIEVIKVRPLGHP